MTYVAQFLHQYPELRSSTGDKLSSIEAEYQQLRQWLLDTTLDLSDTHQLPIDINEYLAVESEVKKKTVSYRKLLSLVDSRSTIRIASESWKEIDLLWRKLHAQMRHWLYLLDCRLPPPFNDVGEWLFKAECMIEDNEIPPVMNEETAAIISAKLEQHKAFFSEQGKVEEDFATGMRDEEAVSRVPKQQLEVMAARLRDIGPRAHVRRIRLKFLEHKCCLIAFMELTESKVRSWTVKYGPEPKVRQLMDQYDSFVSKNKIFQEFNRAYIDMKHVVDEYRREGRISERESAQVDKFMRETDERWKGICMELRCVRSMLEEVSAHWHRWSQLSQEIEQWLSCAEQNILSDEQNRLEFFQDIGVWKEKYQVLCDTVSFLVATCDDQCAKQLKEKFKSITARWEHLFIEVKHYAEVGDTLRKRKEYRQMLDHLQAWLRGAEQTLAAQNMNSVEKIKIQVEKLQVLHSEMEGVEELFKSISKKFQTLILDLSRDEVDQMMALLKKEKESLVKVRAWVNVQMQVLNQVLVQQESLEACQAEITAWLDSAQQHIGQTRVSGNRDHLLQLLEKHKVFFSRSLYFKSMLDSKNKLLSSLVNSVKKSEGVDTKDFEARMHELNARFVRVTQEATSLEQRLMEAVRSWQNLCEVERVINEWIATASKLLADKQPDSPAVINNQKAFFEHVNEKWFVDLNNSVQDLLKCLPPEEHQQILERANTLKSKWNEIISVAPLHIVKLEFSVDEQKFTKYLKELDKELTIETQAFNRNENIPAILARNKAFFEEGSLNNDMKECLARLEKRCLVSVAEWPEEGRSLQATVGRLRDTWDSLLKRKDSLVKQMQSVPDQWALYNNRFREMEEWMDSVDKSVVNLLKELATAEEFETERRVFEGICREVDARREDMKWLVQTLESLTAHGCTPSHNQGAEQSRLDALVARYKRLIPTIEMTIVKTELYSKWYIYRKEVNQVCDLLTKVSEGQMKSERSEGVAGMLTAQEKLVKQLDDQRSTVVSMLQRGRDLSKDSQAPAFLSQQVSRLETQWNQAYNTTLDKLNSLKATQKLWQTYTESKNEIAQLLEKADAELSDATRGPGSYQQVRSDLESKQRLCISLRQATELVLKRLRELCLHLSTAIPDTQHTLHKEVKELETRLESTLQIVEKRVVILEALSAEWGQVENELETVRQWSEGPATASLSKLSLPTSTVQERAAAASTLRAQLSDRAKLLDSIKKRATQLVQGEPGHKLTVEVCEVESSLGRLQASLEQEGATLERGVATLERFQQCSAPVKVWLDESELGLSMTSVKPSSLDQAEQILQQAQRFVMECEEKNGEVEALREMCSQGGSPGESLIETAEALACRLGGVQRAARQRAAQADKLVLAWRQLEAATRQAQVWLDGPRLAELSRSEISPSTMEAQLADIKEVLSELGQVQGELVSLGQAAEVISQGLTLEAATAVKERLAALKSRADAVSDVMRKRADLISEAVVARKELETEVKGVSEWLLDTERRLAGCERVAPGEVAKRLDSLHALLHDHTEQTPKLERR